MDFRYEYFKIHLSHFAQLATLITMIYKWKKINKFILILNCHYDSMPFWVSFNWMSFCSIGHHLGTYGKVFKQGLFKNFLHNVNLSVGTSFLLNSSKLQKWNSRNKERNILNKQVTNAQLGLEHYKFTCSKKLGLNIVYLTRSL
jgi:hypothetical protein